MPQTANVVIAGVTYENVPSVVLPTAGGGTAEFSLGGGGKTIASIAPTGVPTAWSSVQASYECGLVDCDNDVAQKRTASINRGAYRTYNTLDPNKFGVVTCPTVSSLADGVTIYAEDPNGDTTLPSFAAPGTSPSESVGGWATDVEMIGEYGLDLRYVFRFTDSGGVASGTSVYVPNDTTPAGFYAEAADGGVRYVVVCEDGTEVRSTVRPVAESGVVWERCECVGVTGTPTATSPGYLVTYSDSTTETFPASSGDVADGSY